MSKVPSLSYKKIISALKRDGWITIVDINQKVLFMSDRNLLKSTD
jgi:predicted RNA binding protein YcfA (HicA-like mRNA interferase family)